jgi:hypothetical protein
MPEPVAWRYDATSQPRLRVLFLAGVGLVYGVPLLVVGSAVVLLGFTLWYGSWELRLLVGLFALVGGPASLLYLLPMLRDPDQRPTFYPESVERPGSVRTRWAAGVVGAASLAVAWWVAVPLAAGLVAVAALAGLGYVLAATRGHVDPDAATLRLGPREFDLSPVTGYRTRRIGPLALVTLSVPTRPGRFGGVPARFVVPSDRRGDVTAALDAVVDANEAQDTAGRDSNPVVRGVAATLALLFVGAGVGGVVLVGAGVGWYVAALCWLFAVVFLVVAREG